MQLQNKTFFARGKRGVVYTADLNGKKVAIKEKREDSKAMGRIENEARFLKLLNKYNIGPEFIESGENYLVYTFVEGEFILDFIEKNEKEEIKKVLLDVFSQCHTMDKLGINKEEMHHPIKHVIVGTKVKMIDFERCRYTEKAHNVTQFVQFVTGTKLSTILNKKGFKIDVEKLRNLAREYKNNLNEENYKKIK